MAEANEEPRLGLETLGNATLVFSEDGRPVLATDPWLTGPCYFGSWALDRPLTRNELDTVLASEYIWISHGHPDHFHPQSLALLPRGKKILLPDHYSGDIASFLTAQGFAVDDLALGTLDTRFRSLPVKRLVGTRAQRVEAVTYWIMIGDTPVANATARRLAKMRFGLNGAVPDGLVFRVSSVSDDRERAYGEQASLVRDLLDAVNDKTRNKLIGSID